MAIARSVVLVIQMTFALILGASDMLYAQNLFETINTTYTKTAPYQPPTQKDVEKAQQLFYSLFTSSPTETDPTTWASLGFEVQKVGTFIIILEQKTAQTGKGIYVFNTSKPSSLVLEVPHRPSDERTGPIAAYLMEEGPFLAGAWNSVHRKKADLGKEDLSYFNAFTSAFGQAFPKGTILQLHGFDEETHDVGADIIFSATISDPPPLFHLYEKCLEKLPAVVLSYPNSVDVLGGTKNINAKKFREVAKDGLFLHIEMGLPFRERLLNDEALRRKFMSCFQEKNM